MRVLFCHFIADAGSQQAITQFLVHTEALLAVISFYSLSWIAKRRVNLNMEGLSPSHQSIFTFKISILKIKDNITYIWIRTLENINHNTFIL